MTEQRTKPDASDEWKAICQHLSSRIIEQEFVGSNQMIAILCKQIDKRTRFASKFVANNADPLAVSGTACSVKWQPSLFNQEHSHQGTDDLCPLYPMKPKVVGGDDQEFSLWFKEIIVDIFWGGGGFASFVNKNALGIESDLSIFLLSEWRRVRCTSL